MHLFSAIRRVFAPRTGTTVSRAFDPESFLRICEESPEEARAMLAADQSALAREIEKTFEAYDARLADLASRVHAISPEQLQREAQNIRVAQDALRRALRRLDVSVKTAQELDRELAGWEDREDASEIHADHPAFRSEIIRSELRSRGMLGAEQGTLSNEQRAESMKQQGKAHAKQKIVSTEQRVLNIEQKAGNALLWLTHDDVQPVADIQDQKMDEDVLEPLTMPEVEYLLQAIREATRESERWHAIPAQHHDEETLLQVHHTRDLHALLKRLDRERGAQRDRMALAISPREMR